VKVRVAAHEHFTRQGRNIHLSIGANVAQAMLGDEVDVETLDGPAALKIPAGTQSGQQFRMRGKGVPDMRGHDRGDQIVTVHVVIPSELNDEQRDLVERLAESFGDEVMPQPSASRGFFDKVKDALGV
jgi:molecular chaperone DnaJ